MALSDVKVGFLMAKMCAMVGFSKILYVIARQLNDEMVNSKAALLQFSISGIGFP